MAIEIKMPRLSQTTDEVRLLNWLVRVGDTVGKGDPLCEVETDKVTMEVESFEGGTVLEILAEADTVIDAGTVIALLGEKGERVQKPVKERAEKEEAAEERGLFSDSTKTSASSVQPGEGIRATKLVRHIAQKRNIDLRMIKGTGPRGMITKADLESFTSPGTSAAAAGARGETAGTVGTPVRAAVPLTPHQRAVAHSLAGSSKETPHFYLKTTLVCDRLVSYRDKHEGTEGKRLAVDSFYIFAVSRALVALPRLNGYFKDDRFVPHGSVDINIAISADDELYAPLLQGVEGKSIEEIDADLRKLASKTRENRLERDDMRPGSFTVTNLGMYAVDEFQAIINPPQSGILSIGRMKRDLLIGPDDAMQIKRVCTVTGSFDHRIVNGTQGAAFMQYIQDTLEGLDIP